MIKRIRYKIYKDEGIFNDFIIKIKDKEIIKCIDCKDLITNFYVRYVFFDRKDSKSFCLSCYLKGVKRENEEGDKDNYTNGKEFKNDLEQFKKDYAKYLIIGEL